MDKEIRSISTRFESNGRIVSGYAIRFNEESVNMGFVEIIKPEALTRSQVEDSDIFAFYNHNPEHVLARNGRANTLRLDLREDGLYYEFEAPDTAIGNELIEHIKRNEMYGTSFAFSMDVDGEGETWSRREDGTILREITSIEHLYEISPVFSPAYPTTSVSARSIEMIEKLNNELNQDNNMTEDKTLRNDEDIKDEDENKQQETQEQKGGDCADCIDDDEKRQDEDENEEDKETKDKDEDENTDNEQETKASGDEENPDDEDENKNTEKNNNHRTMEQKFSLLRSIRTIANGEKLDEATQNVIDSVREEMRASGLAVNGQIQIPIGEKLDKRSVVTVTAEGDDVVVTDFTNILEPLHSKNVMNALGCRILTGLVGDVQVPSMTAENVFWGSEISDAQDGAGTFSHVILSPRRLTSFIDISRQMLLQDSLGVENLIRAELVNALNQKLEDTIFSASAASGNTPAGIFNGMTDNAITDFASLCALEASVEENNVYGDMKYLLSPKSKATLRSMSKSSKLTQLVLDGPTIDGTPFESTTHMASKKLAYGDWSNLCIGFWQNADILVDPYTQAAKGCVRVIISAYVDYKLLRPQSIVFAHTA